MGDASDGYPGVKGIGPKTALKLIQQFGSIDGVLEALPTLKAGQRIKIGENEGMLRLSYQLAQIYCEAPIEKELEQLAVPAIYAPQLENLQQRGLRLIVKHAKSLGL